VVEILFETLFAALAAGADPEQRIVVRLDDGRLRLLPGGAAERLAVLRNESGPGEAYRVGCRRTGDRAVLEVAEADGAGRAWRRECWRGPEGWQAGPVEFREPQAEAAELSRKAAIFAASLGMVTGALPKVAAIGSPEGVSSAPVW
jgi:hypothetical protein